MMVVNRGYDEYLQVNLKDFESMQFGNGAEVIAALSSLCRLHGLSSGDILRIEVNTEDQTVYIDSYYDVPF